MTETRCGQSQDKKLRTAEIIDPVVTDHKPLQKGRKSEFLRVVAPKLRTSKLVHSRQHFVSARRIRLPRRSSKCENRQPCPTPTGYFRLKALPSPAASAVVRLTARRRWRRSNERSLIAHPRDQFETGRSNQDRRDANGKTRCDIGKPSRISAAHRDVLYGKGIQECLPYGVRRSPIVCRLKSCAASR